MIGNAVPVKLAQYIAQGITAYHHQVAHEQLFLFDTPETFTIPTIPLHRLVTLAPRSGRFTPI